MIYVYVTHCVITIIARDRPARKRGRAGPGVRPLGHTCERRLGDTGSETD